MKDWSVANTLGGHPPQVNVLPVFLDALFLQEARLLVDAGSHDQEMQFFQRPAFFDKPSCQPVE
jgi:hypothetical protein